MKRTRSLFIAVCTGALLWGVGVRAQAQSASDESSSGASAQDAKLEKKIDYRLQHDQKLKARNVDASVSDGVVTLTGTVRSSAEKSHAEHLAHMKGVSSVENQLQIEGQETKSAAPTESEQTPPPSEAQPAEPSSPGNAKESTTHVEERTETRTEHEPQPAQQPQEKSSAPADENVQRPAEPNAPMPPK